MIKIILKKHIEYSTGDTFSLNITPTAENEFVEGMTLQFIVSESEQSDPIIDKTFNINDDLTFTVALDSEDIKKLPIGGYIYKMISYKNNERDTEISGDFTVKWGA